MRAGRKRWLWLALVLMSVMVLGFFAFFSGEGYGASKVSISFIGYTNAPDDSKKVFAVLSLTNIDTSTIINLGLFSESRGFGSDMSPLLSGVSPGLAQSEFKPGEGKFFLVPKPMRAGKWRILFLYGQRTPKQKLVEFLRDHPGMIRHLPSSSVRWLATPVQTLTETSIWMKAESHY